ncbi:hypothetical protein V1511DRAFT_458440 [Dipodascopsis uninucleata]
MSSELFYSFFRITIAQILRSAGIDRCAPSVLDTLTDITIRYMALLANKAISNAILCGRDEPLLSDVRMAMESAGGLKPTRLLDESEDEELEEDNEEAYDPRQVNDEGLQRFYEWCFTTAREMRSIIGNQELIDGLMKKQTKVSQEDRFKGTILEPTPEHINMSDDGSYDQRENKADINGDRDMTESVNYRVKVEGNAGPEILAALESAS